MNKQLFIVNKNTLEVTTVFPEHMDSLEVNITCVSTPSEKIQHTVTFTRHKYDPLTCTINSSTPEIIHDSSVSSENPSEFHALLYVIDDTLHTEICYDAENDGGVVQAAIDTGTDCILSISSIAFDFEKIEKDDVSGMFTFNGKYCEYLTNPSAESLLSDSVSDALYGQTALLDNIVRYSDFDDNSYNISEYLHNEFTVM